MCVRPITVLVPDGSATDGGKVTVNMALNQSLEDALVQEMEAGTAWGRRRLRSVRAGRALQAMCPTPLWCVIFFTWTWCSLVPWT